eukprot:COSAG02_NODE_661_length_18757_cov_4.427699_16_plen_127_part_00
MPLRLQPAALYIQLKERGREPKPRPRKRDCRRNCMDIGECVMVRQACQPTGSAVLPFSPQTIPAAMSARSRIFGSPHRPASVTAAEDQRMAPLARRFGVACTVPNLSESWAPLSPSRGRHAAPLVS